MPLLMPGPPAANKLTGEDFEMVIAVARQFGLLREGAEERISELLDEFYEKEKIEKLTEIYGENSGGSNE